jgi:sialate O-acetylesterase
MKRSHRALASLALALVLPSLELLADRPLQHLVLAQFKAGVSPREVDRITREFQELPARVPGVTGFQWGIDNSPEGLQKGLTHAFFVTFESAAARAAAAADPARIDFVTRFRAAAEQIFVFDFHVDKAPEPAAPGRVHHLVFFKYKDGADLAKIGAAFAELPRKIPGLETFQAGENAADSQELSRGFTHAYVLTFVNGDARDDYIVHPAHKDFVALVGPALEGVQVVDFTVRPSERALLVTEGLEPYRVYQRGEDGAAALSFSGLAGGEGAIEARLTSGRRVVEGFDWRQAGKAGGGAFKAALAGVPAGGEYTVEIRRRDALGNVAEVTDVPNILVGDVWMLAGQSNMEGYGDLIDVEAPSPLVHCFSMAHRWELAVEPLHWLGDSRDPVHYGRRFDGLDEESRRQRRAEERRGRKKGAGLGLAFAKHLVEETGVPVGLIAAAHGGTSMTQWDPALEDQGGASLYGSMLKSIRRAGGKVRGVLWYQGESDANPDAAPRFSERFKTFVESVRADLGSPQAAFYYVQIGRFVLDGESKHWKSVQEAQRTLWKEIPGSGVVSVIDLELDDLIHVGTKGLKRAGVRLAKLARRDLFGDKALQRGPQPAGVAVEDGGRTLRVRFDGVNGRLLPEGEVLGFSLRKADGAPLATIYKAFVDPERSDTVLLKLQNPAPEGAALWYGDGLNPTCNLVDEEDLAAPAFGPMELGG